jgi:hypothetical protein
VSGVTAERRTIDPDRTSIGTFGPVAIISSFVLEAEAILPIDGKPDPRL